MEPGLPRLLIVADLSDALTSLGGISLLERLRRSVRQLGFREATILSNSVESAAAHLSKVSWHGTDVSLKFRERSGTETTVGDIEDCVTAMNVPRGERLLVFFADFYCDGRSLRPPAEAQHDSVLLIGQPASGFVLLCGWGIASAAVHILRAFQIRLRRVSPQISQIYADQKQPQGFHSWLPAFLIELFIFRRSGFEIDEIVAGSELGIRKSDCAYRADGWQ
jgi:hypothetical protein